jgi:iron transport multicopper oxidase
MFTALTTGSSALDPAVYGPGVNPYVIRTGQVVQIVVENDDDTAHPIHFHGYRFQVVARGPGSWDGDTTALPEIPMTRDTVTTPPSGHLVLRILADNPGVWACKKVPFFDISKSGVLTFVVHCHMELHLAGGMMVTFIESPDLMQTLVKVPAAQLGICDSPVRGNCAGNFANMADTRGCKNDPDSYG